MNQALFARKAREHALKHAQLPQAIATEETGADPAAVAAHADDDSKIEAALAVSSEASAVAASLPKRILPENSRAGSEELSERECKRSAP
jgi:hypothetical protein